MLRGNNPNAINANADAYVVCLCEAFVVTLCARSGGRFDPNSDVSARRYDCVRANRLSMSLRRCCRRW
jgi:hypothetical protein